MRWKDPVIGGECPVLCLVMNEPARRSARFFCRRRRSQHPRAMRPARTAIPPITPPAMGPVLDFFAPGFVVEVPAAAEAAVGEEEEVVLPVVVEEV
jgi:hypothetical protein